MERKIKNGERGYILIAVTVLWFVFMTWLSHQNGAQTVMTSGFLAKKLAAFFQVADVAALDTALRKAAHTAVFAVLTLLVLLTLKSRDCGWRAFLAAFAALVVWAWADEATKPLMTAIGLISGRHFAWTDVGLNVLGVGTGTAFAALLLRLAS